MAGLGAVIRNKNGRIMAAALSNSSFQGDFEYVKAEAVRYGVQITRCGIDPRQTKKLSNLLWVKKGLEKKFIG